VNCLPTQRIFRSKKPPRSLSCFKLRAHAHCAHSFSGRNRLDSRAVAVLQRRHPDRKFFGAQSIAPLVPTPSSRKPCTRRRPRYQYKTQKIPTRSAASPTSGSKRRFEHVGTFPGCGVVSNSPTATTAGPRLISISARGALAASIGARAQPAISNSSDREWWLAALPTPFLVPLLQRAYTRSPLPFFFNSNAARIPMHPMAE